MRLYLVHHGDAVAPDVNAQRPLSPRGVSNTTVLAGDAARRGARPAVVWHSGKLRARQTAEAFWRACNPLAEFSAIRGLQPADPPVWIQDRVTGERRDVMCVGHLPHFARTLALLVEGDEGAPVSFPVNGVVALEPGEGARWVEVWRLEP